MPERQKYKKGYLGRRNYSRVSGDLDLPNLIEVQTGSYDWFIKEGMDEALKEIFPIKSPNGALELSYVSCRLVKPLKDFTPLECKERELTYHKRLEATLRLLFKNSGEVKEDPVYLGDIPMMTESGTFVIAGSEKVIVSQLVRSPGAYMVHEDTDKSGKKLYRADLIPSRGSYVQFENDIKDILSVRINRTKKMNATALLKAIGLVKHDFHECEQFYEDLFGKNQYVINTLKKDKDNDDSTSALRDIFKKIKPGDPTGGREGSPEERRHLEDFLYKVYFDQKRYDLGKAGRFKFGQKLGIYNRLVGRKIAENISDSNGEILFKAGTILTKDNVDILQNQQFFEKCTEAAVKSFTKDKEKIDKDFEKKNPEDQIDYSGLQRSYPYAYVLPINENIETGEFRYAHGTVNILKVYSEVDPDRVTTVVGNCIDCKEVVIDAKDNNNPTRKITECNRVTTADIVATFSYFLNIIDGIGNFDDIDHLGNRRIRQVGELLQSQFHSGLVKMQKAISQRMMSVDAEHASFTSLINIKGLTNAVHEFFATSQLSQFMDQTNPLAELTNKRRLSALGPGGIARDRASSEVRDVHSTHYGRICPIETPEGQTIGLINSLASYAKINKFGFIQTPFRKVIKEGNKMVVSNKLEDCRYLSADDEKDYTISGAAVNMDEKGTILDKEVVARLNGENILAHVDTVDYIDVSPKQVVSVATACIPFLENDDSHRALMGANMQRQALPLLKPTAPFVGTGLEHKVAKDSGLSVVCKNDGTVSYVDSLVIKVKRDSDGKDDVYELQKFVRSNKGTCINQTTIVHKGDKVKEGQIIADGPAMDNGELALGQNVTIAFMTWNGYNYEDAVIMSEKLVKEDTYTSIYIDKQEVDCRETRNGPEKITREINAVSEDLKSHLDENGIVIKGAEVKEGEILVGKMTPKGTSEPTPEEKLLMSIFQEKSKDGKDTSLRVPHGGSGIVLDVKVFKSENGDALPQGVLESVKVFIVQKRKISEGDKMSGRHGNKGVISKILPEEDMPFLEDGTPIDIMLNPLGVPSRMNIGQVLETHLGLACKKLGIKVATPVFDGITQDEIKALMNEAGMDSDGKATLYDGRTGEKFEERITVGVMYMIKLDHMVTDKLHARATGPYSMVTQQPLGGKAQNGGQRFGEMEVWALEAYGAANTLQEILTIKSDDRSGRSRAYESIIKGTPLPQPGIPEAFRVFTKELQALCVDVKLLNDKNQIIDMDILAKDLAQEEKNAFTATKTVRTSDVENESYTLEDVKDNDLLN